MPVYYSSSYFPLFHNFSSKIFKLTDGKFYVFSRVLLLFIFFLIKMVKGEEKRKRNYYHSYEYIKIMFI